MDTSPPPRVERFLDVAMVRKGLSFLNDHHKRGAAWQMPTGITQGQFGMICVDSHYKGRRAREYAKSAVKQRTADSAVVVAQPSPPPPPTPHHHSSHQTQSEGTAATVSAVMPAASSE